MNLVIFMSRQVYFALFAKSFWEGFHIFSALFTRKCQIFLPEIKTKNQMKWLAKNHSEVYKNILIFLLIFFDTKKVFLLIAN